MAQKTVEKHLKIGNIKNMNKVILLGNLTRDPESRSTKNDKTVCNFSLASSRQYKVGDDFKEEVTFVDCEVWGKQAISSQEYLKKGSQILIEGYLKTQSWENKEGEKRSKNIISCNYIKFLNKPAEKTNQNRRSEERDESAGESAEDELF